MPATIGRGFMITVVQLSSRLRIALLVALLLVEIAAVAALRSAGWVATGSGILWLACLLAATLPLVIAAALLFGRKFRFSLRALLVIMALVAVFLVVTGIPLRDAIDARRITLKLVAGKADLRTEPPSESFLEGLGYSVLDRVYSTHRAADLAPWLRPLAGDVLKFPAHDEVRSISFNTDQQIADFASDPAGFTNVESIGVYGNVTPLGLRKLLESLPQLPAITQLAISGITVPPEFLSAFADAEYLMLEAPWPYPRPTPAQRRGSYRRLLGPEHFAAVAALPHLRVLCIQGHDVADADVALLANSKSLEHIIFNRTTVSEAAAKQLRQQLPDCQIHWHGY